jgi:predicted 2-oxoglutarate/Fe(II)-dependent dioxygenase YbiX
MGLAPGTPAPLFSAPSPVNPKFAFGSLGGRYVLLAFLPEPGPERDAAVQLVKANAHHFRDDRLMFFGVLPDRETYATVTNEPPCRWFLDAEHELRGLYRAQTPGGELVPQWVLIDPALRIIGTASLAEGESVLAHVARLGDPDAHAGVPVHAPVLIAPRIFEPELCRRLMDYYHEAGGEPSGVMREKDGKTVWVLDDFKKRRDATITDQGLVAATRARIAQRLLPEIEKAFQFKATHLERYIVACYDAEQGGYFNAHRDNTTPGTAHRKFAVSINLNAEDFEGGDLRFPEFGRTTYRPPTGGAVVFSCSLLHEATPVTRGTRYAFLPFLYDDEAARLRERNLHTFAKDPPPRPEPAPAAG